MGLRQPWRFAAAASLSGAVALSHPSDRADPDFSRLMHTVFGNTPTDGTDDDVLHLMRVADVTALPRLYVACGTEDFLYPANLALLEVARDRGIAVHTDLGPGDHDWEYWDAQIQRVLAWLPLATGT